MNKTSLLLCASVALLAAACRPAGDRSEAQKAGSIATDGTGGVPQAGDPVKEDAGQATENNLPQNVAIAGPTANTAASEADSTPPASAAAIPAQYRGRWGLVPADCEPGRSDAKGLITIADRTIRYYESTATLKEQRPAIATSFSGLFGFTGEGQTWEKVMTFTRTGDKLTRAEEEGTFTYTRCPS